MVLAGSASAGIPANPGTHDNLLDAGPVAPCAARPDYAAGIDATGQAVVPADAAAPPVPAPDSIAVPLHGVSRQARTGETPYVTLDGRKLGSLLNPTPCH